MSEVAVKEELHAIVDSLGESALESALEMLRGLSRAKTEGSRDMSSASDEAETMTEHPHPWFDIIGVIKDDDPTDMSMNHDKYLADAYMDNHDLTPESTRPRPCLLVPAGLNRLPSLRPGLPVPGDRGTR